MANTFDSMRISASGLAAERLKVDIIAGNIANAQNTRGADGQPYRRKVAVFEENLQREIQNGQVVEKQMGIKAVGIEEDPSPFKKVYNPSHPDADEEGYVSMPNVNYLNEMADLMIAVRSFEANLAAMDVNKSMYSKSLEIGR